MTTAVTGKDRRGGHLMFLFLGGASQQHLGGTLDLVISGHDIVKLIHAANCHVTKIVGSMRRKTLDIEGRRRR